MSKQPLRVSVETVRDMDPHPARFEVSEIMDYDRIRDYVLTWSARPHVELLETLILDLVDHCFADPRVDRVRASVAKPAIFPDTDEAAVEVSLTRDAWERR